MQKMMMTTLLAVMSVCGCGLSHGHLKSDPKRTDTFVIDRPVIEVYRDIKTKAQTETIGYIGIVLGDYWPDLNTAEVHLVSTGGFADPLFTVEIRPLSQTQTQVTTFYLMGSLKDTPDRVKVWAGYGNATIAQN